MSVNKGLLLKVFGKAVPIIGSLIILSGCNVSVSPPMQAGQIIQQELRSPSSFKYVAGDVLWQGKSQEDEPAYVVSVAYDAQNGFGAMIRGCTVVAYVEQLGGKIAWSQMFGVMEMEPNDCAKLPNHPQGKAAVVKGMVERNFHR